MKHNRIIPRKIFFIIPSFGGGGAEKLVQLFLTYIDKSLFLPTLVMFEDKITYSIPQDITVISLNKKNRYDFLKLIWRLKRLFDRESPALVVSFLTYANIIAILAKKLSGWKGPIFINENGSLYLLDMERQKRIKSWLIRHLYPLSQSVITVSAGIRDELMRNFAIPGEKIKVIYSGLDLDEIFQLAQEVPNHPWYAEDVQPILISVGRLTQEKAHIDLLRAFAIVRKHFPCRLVIMGEGVERANLERVAQESGIREALAFLGFQRNPFNFIFRSTLFILSSHYEGIPNVIIGAMACGVPVISTRCPSGPEEVISDGVNGLLVPVGDIEAMVSAILKLLKDPSLRRRLAEAGKRRAEDFRIERMVKEYEDVFKTF